jgi:hypothetical protein
LAGTNAVMAVTRMCPPSRRKPARRMGHPCCRSQAERVGHPPENLETRLYKIAHSDVMAKPEVSGNLLKELVGERGFEPPTPWSRTRFSRPLKPAESCCLQLIDVEPVACLSLRAMESYGTWMLWQPQNRLHKHVAALLGTSRTRGSSHSGVTCRSVNPMP